MPSASARTLRPVQVRFTPLGVFALESRHARGFSMPALRHDFLKILLPFHGEGRLRAGDTELPVRPGFVLVVPPGCEHRIEDLRPLSLHAICLRPAEFSEGFPVAICKSGEVCLFPDTAGEWAAWARAVLHEQSAPSAGSSALLRSLAWRLLAALARAAESGRAAAAETAAALTEEARGSHARVRAAAEELRHGFHEPLTLEVAARRAGLGRRRFTQLFRELHGRTWWEALVAARLDHAERLLRRGERSVTAVAFECGFGDLSGFYRAWGSRHELSPAAWRSRAS